MLGCAPFPTTETHRIRIDGIARFFLSISVSALDIEGSAVFAACHAFSCVDNDRE